MSDNLRAEIAFFFMPPKIEPKWNGKYSVLYLLRRDIQGCVAERKYLWPATMAILAGIDLLGKFLAGNDKAGEVSQRFRTFIDRYFKSISPGDAQVIYQLRNALLHSFGLYSRAREGKYHFGLIFGQMGSLVESLPSDFYQVNADRLYQLFEEAIASYRADLETSSDLLCPYASFS